MSDAATPLTFRQVKRDGEEWERVVFAEVLIPDTPNVYGDISSREDIVNFVHEYARQGYGLDVDHDEVNVKNVKFFVVESFIARDGDPDFIDGSWVVGCKIIDDELWTDILEGRINGYSYQAEVYMLPVEYTVEASYQVVGVTEPNPLDGHVHDFLVIVDHQNALIAGSTSEVAGHTHRISSHTTTDVSDGHNHRYQIVE